MSTNKPDFLDDVVSGMGNDKGSTDYGADAEDSTDNGADEGDETAGEDRMMAAKQLTKALGMPGADASKVAEALKAFVATCM